MYQQLNIVRITDNKKLTAFLKAYASGLITLPEGMMEPDTETTETEQDIAILIDEDISELLSALVGTQVNITVAADDSKITADFATFWAKKKRHRNTRFPWHSFDLTLYIY